MDFLPIHEAILRLAAAAVLSGFIGWERESGRRPAGLRTHMLVAVGSALLMLVSQSIFLQFRDSAQADPGRIAAQVVSGIGFLGAGTILREGPTVRGLTTAASLWVAAALGLAVGAGAYLEAVATTALTLVALIYLGRLERRAQKKGKMTELNLRVDDRPGQLGRIGSVLGRYRVDIRHIELNPLADQQVRIQLSVVLPPRLDLTALFADLSALDGMLELKTDDSG